MECSAFLSECGMYRYWLRRTWDPTLSEVCWIMLNPSTADAQVDDPTIRRCLAFSRDWGFGSLLVVNLFALRATNPKALKVHYPVASEIQAENDLTIQTAARGRPVIAAWGNHGRLLNRNNEVMALLKGHQVQCLGVTQFDQPKHPLYLPDVTERVPYPAVRPYELV